jgi:hypothetical protein
VSIYRLTTTDHHDHDVHRWGAFYDDTDYDDISLESHLPAGYAVVPLSTSADVGDDDDDDDVDWDDDDLDSPPTPPHRRLIPVITCAGQASRRHGRVGRLPHAVPCRRRVLG